MIKDKILIVDDEAGNVLTLELMLQDKYDIIKIDNGEKALEIAKKELPDLIILDIIMPGMDGLEVCKILTEDVITRDIPIILISAKIQDEDVKTGLDIGAIDYIKKPISHIELDARVKVALRIKHREDELRRLNKIKNDFLQIVSHDLVSPFSAILSSSSILLSRDFDNPLNSSQRELVELINKSSQKQVKYVKDLLFLALQESENYKITPSEYNLKSVIDEVINSNRFLANEKNISLTSLIPEDIIIPVDVNKIIQVFNNLIVNSIKFTNRNGYVEISCNKYEHLIDIYIKDNGRGMSKEKILELIRDGKVYSTPGTEEEMGTGLGVKICRKIIEAHGGKILIDSEVGKGTTFTIILPLN